MYGKWPERSDIAVPSHGMRIKFEFLYVCPLNIRIVYKYMYTRKHTYNVHTNIDSQQSDSKWNEPCNNHIRVHTTHTYILAIDLPKRMMINEPLQWHRLNFTPLNGFLLRLWILKRHSFCYCALKHRHTRTYRSNRATSFDPFFLIILVIKYR